MNANNSYICWYLKDKFTNLKHQKDGNTFYFSSASGKIPDAEEFSNIVINYYKGINFTVLGRSSSSISFTKDDKKDIVSLLRDEDSITMTVLHCDQL
ncbi:MAG: hypothetical protein ACI9GH_000566 [Candidatus Paceibacteria bacterium]|jgi:hypothetical protein